ncbi:Histidine kinase [Micromonospora phaseoli]|uniref:histidine kinase n=1 Tax=Micromonospora phaseoli TaxID=1144548 RepID=A0A1H7CP16_9ACTN|nr:histidine kinase [Micromonospora phaseoli]PZV91645.1 histidine kinase [Micromonospora phaseoli]GIJ79276.1 histidine kinase [Micromonospora phaseoli]SEJ91341.1 Histidine kinase [Micromonospora phaseoli]
MNPRAALRPLIAGTTWQRGVFLLLGGVLAVPYGVLAVTFAQLFGSPEVPWPLVFVLLVPATVIAVVPVFLRGSRALEIAAVRGLLGVDLPEPVPGRRLDRETRLRAALWIGLHLLSGGLVVAALFSAVPLALGFILAQTGVDVGITEQDGFGPLDGRDTGWLSVAGVLVLIGLGYAVAGLGALAASMAPTLLGPAPAERIAALEVRAAGLAERNRLARELHDSVGHALTVATLQAGAAREVLDRDPEFVRRALSAIEETGRRAMDDLDHVLGLLRETDEPSAAGPQRTLVDLPQLVADTRATGQPVHSQVHGVLDALPPVVSREGYRIIQEGLTNAARHGRGPVTLRIDVPSDGLEIELVNDLPRPAPGDVAGPAGGRGLVGMRERVLLLGGGMTAGPSGDRWRVRVRLPIEAAG